MQISPFPDVNPFGSVAGKYLQGPANFSQLFNFLPDLAGLLQAVAAREKISGNNQILYEVLTEQLSDYFSSYPKVKENVESFLSPATLSITTGHQLSLLGGPAYLYYKISTVIALARQTSQLTGVKVVPVFWLASEDHDIEEIRGCKVKNKSFSWTGNWNGYAGVLPTDLLQDWIKETCKELSESQAPQFLIDRITKSYGPGKSLSTATRDFLMDVFGIYGLVIIDADCAKLKTLFTPLVIEELSQQKSETAMQDILSKWPEIWGMAKLEPQVKPRSINLFYLDNFERHRIVRDENGNFLAGNIALGNLEFVVNLAKSNPEKFSPNVVLRPLYQEILLPNIAYVGGPGEIHYWLELKPVFDSYKVFFPALLPRSSYMVLSNKQMEKWISLGLTLSEFNGSLANIQQKLLAQLDNSEIDWDLLQGRLAEIYDGLLNKMAEIDPTLKPVVSAELTKTIQGINHLKSKLNKSVKGKNEIVMRQSERIYGELFPTGQPQERVENGLGFEWSIGPEFIDSIVSRDVLPGDSVAYLINY